MRMASRVKTLLLLLLIWGLLSPSVWASDSSWVLWHKFELLTIDRSGQTMPSTTWEIVNAYPLHADCAGAKHHVWKSNLDGYADASKTPGIERVTSVKDEIVSAALKATETRLSGSMTSTYLCLPGTLDPRDPASR